MMKKLLLFTLCACTLLLVGFALPEKPTIPVAHATSADWHPDSFWYEPWGASGVHKGIDIFAAKGTPVLASTHGLVVSTGEIGRGGNYVLLLGANWRLHYFAHLQSIKTKRFAFVRAGDVLGAVGDTGNAKGKPAHLHYSIRRLIPDPRKADDSTQGYKKAYFINPAEFLLVDK